MGFLKKLIICSLIVFLSFPISFLTAPSTKATEKSEEISEPTESDIADEDVKPQEDNSISGIFNKIGDVIGTIQSLISGTNPKLIISEQDIEAIREGKVDEGILKTLIYLVTPEDQGGAGFKRLKIKRLVKGYATEKRALSKETEYADEGEANISAHFKGQAVDISEIDEIKRKVKIKKKAIGVTISSKTKELPPVPINVAWQSEKGKGEGVPGFYGLTANELFGNLSLGSIKDVLSDYIDYDLDNLAGDDFPEWAKWLGVIMLFEDFDLPTKGFEEEQDFKGMLREMGRATLAENLGIEKEAIKGGSREELILNIGRSYLEKSLGLEQGSLTGDTIEEIFKNAGKRKLEKELGLPKGSLDNSKEKLKKIKESPVWKTYKTNEARNEAFDMPEGSAELIEAGDENGLVLAGAGVLLYVLAAENKKEIIEKIKQKEPITFEIKINETSLKVDVDVETLKKIASRDNNKRKEALKVLGEKALASLALHPDLSLGLTKKEWQNVLSGKTKIDDLAITVGARKYENELNLPKNALYYTLKSGKIEDLTLNLGRASLEEEGKNPNDFSDNEKKEIGKTILKQRVAEEINKEYGLTAKCEITDQDIIDLLNGKWENVTQKIAGAQIDKALGFPKDGTMDIIKGNKTAEQVLKESGAIRFGKFLGLSSPVSLEGNLKQNYGQALVEDNLGLKPGSFSGTISEVKAKNTSERFDAIFAKPENIDGIFGIKTGTTRNLIEGKISVADYSKQVADMALKKVAFDKLANYFGLESWKNIEDRKKEFNKILSTIQNWDSASGEDKAAVFSFLEKVSGQSFDEALGFEAGTIETIIANPSNAPDILLTQGMKKLNKGIFGIEKDIIVLHYKEGKGLTATIDNKALQDWALPKIKETTDIPDDEDAKCFLNGNIKDGFIYWGIASVVKETNEIFTRHNMPNVAAEMTYENAKKACFGDKEARKNFQYKVIDAYLIDKVDENIPVGFTKVMFEGTPAERTAMMESYAINLISAGKIQVSAQQMQAVNDYLKNKTPENFENLKRTGIFGTLDGFLKQYDIFGIPILPGFSEALFNGVGTGDYKQLTSLYKDWEENQVFAWFDKKFNLDPGTTKQVYDAYKAYQAGEMSTTDLYILGAQLVFGDKISKGLAKMDDKLGLPPGTSQAILIYAAIGNPVPLIMALAFKTSVEYYGEKPICEQVETEPTTIKSSNDIISKLLNKNSIISKLLSKISMAGYERLSGDPEKDFPFYQRHAQCSVKRLIGALLLMPEKTGDKTLRPTQILTYRPEDVDFYADKVYELYGKTQAERGWRGLFSNDLMWQWVHIGY